MKKTIFTVFCIVFNLQCNNKLSSIKSNQNIIRDSSSVNTSQVEVIDTKEENTQTNTNTKFYGIRPNHLNQKVLEQQLLAYYIYWKNKYVKSSNGKTPGGGYFVEMQGVGPNGEISKSTSEAHGYGMIIFALIDNLDSEAKTYFDGMFNMFDKHRSTENQYNASWILTINEDLNYGSATDGDFDIAYSLLLANKSWGSNGEINYLQHAKNTIQFGLKVNDISQSYRPTLGDWASRSSFDTRSSDFMPDHFRAYKLATNDNFWDNPVNTVYDVISKIQSQFSSKTGLVPDFIIGSDPRPATNNYLDEATVDFSWNACRLPLRLAIDYGLYGSNEAKVSLTKIMQWVIKDTGGDPSKIKSGYFLDGQPQVNETSAAFISPIVAAASIDSTYQRFLNDGWDYMVKTKESYYADTITLLSLLYLSGVWQRPN